MTKRRQRAGSPQSGGLSLKVFTSAELSEIHQATIP